MSLAKRVLVLILGNGLTQIVNMVFMMIVVRVLATHEYATYQQANLIANTIMPFLILGIPISLSCFIPKFTTRRESKTLVIQTFIIMNIMGLIGMSLIFIFSNIISAKYNNLDLSFYLKMYSIYVFLEVAISYYPNYFLGTDRSKKLAVISFIFSIVKMFFLLICIFVFSSKLKYLFWGVIISSFIKYIWIVFEMMNYYKYERFQFSTELIKEQFAYSIPIGLSSIIGILAATLDKNMVAYFFKPEQYAVFANGAFEIPLIEVITGSITAVLIPELSRLYNKQGSNNEKILDIWKNSIVSSCAILVPIMFGLMVFSKGFVLFLFSEKYLASIPIFEIYLLTLPLRSINFGSMLIISNNQNKILINSGISIVLSFILNLILIKLLGFYGAALAIVFSAYFLAILQSYQILKEFRTSINKLFPWKKISLIVFISFITSMPFVFLNKYTLIGKDIIKFFLFGGIYIVLDIIILISIKVLDKKAILGIMK